MKPLPKRPLKRLLLRRPPLKPRKRPQRKKRRQNLLHRHPPQLLQLQHQSVLALVSSLVVNQVVKCYRKRKSATTCELSSKLSSNTNIDMMFRLFSIHISRRSSEYQSADLTLRLIIISSQLSIEVVACSMSTPSIFC